MLLMLVVALLLPIPLRPLGPARARAVLSATLVLLALAVVVCVGLEAEFGIFTTRGTYGSDETYYYDMMRGVVEGSQISEGQSAAGWIWLGAQILRLSPSMDPVWIRLVNAVLYAATFELFCLALLRRSARLGVLSDDTLDRRLVWTLFGLFSNGIALFMVARILKETALVFLIAVLCYSIGELASATRLVRRVVPLLVCLVSSALLASFRIGMDLLLVPLLLVGCAFYLYRQYLFVRRRLASFRARAEWWLVRVVIAVLVSGAFLLINSYMLAERVAVAGKYVEAYTENATRVLKDPVAVEFASYGDAGYLLAAGRFIFGPGPIRAFQQVLTQGVFLTSCHVGDYLILLGSLQWWGSMLLVVVCLLRFRKWLPMFITLDYSTLCVVQIASYSYVYFGSGETRHRAMMYLLAAPAIALILSRRERLRRTVRALPASIAVLGERRGDRGRPRGRGFEPCLTE